MARIEMVFYVICLTAIYLTQCKNYLIEVADDEIEDDKKEPKRELLKETGFDYSEDQTELTKETQDDKEEVVTQGPQIPLEDIGALKEDFEAVFGKNWNPSEVKEIFEEHVKGDYTDDDLVDSTLLVSMTNGTGTETLIPMGNIKVRYASSLIFCLILTCLEILMLNIVKLLALALTNLVLDLANLVTKWPNLT